MKKNKDRHVDTLLRSYPGVISNEDCQMIIDYVEYMESVNMVNQRHDVRTRDVQLNAASSPMVHAMAAEQRGISSEQLTTINLKSTEVSQGIMSKVNQGLEEYATTLGLKDQLPELFTMDCLIQKSNADTFDQYSRWHAEAGELMNCDRAMAWMIYLNDDFEGGETEFKFQKHREIPEAGKLVIWPASFTHTHRGGMITDGMKYIATGWIHYGGSRSFTY